jgi:hypothetical protein
MNKKNLLNSIKGTVVKSYLNPDENRNLIYEENRNKSGIYC